jgi:hypothetical protein
MYEHNMVLGQGQLGLNIKDKKKIFMRGTAAEERGEEN